MRNYWLSLIPTAILFASPFMRGQDANLPGTPSPHRVEITSNGRLYLQRNVTRSSRGTRVTLAQLTRRLTQEGEDPATEVVVIKTSQATSYGQVTTIMDRLRQAGITHVSLLTADRKSGQLLPPHAN